LHSTFDQTPQSRILGLPEQKSLLLSFMTHIVRDIFLQYIIGISFGLSCEEILLMWIQFLEHFLYLDA